MSWSSSQESWSRIRCCGAVTAPEPLLRVDCGVVAAARGGVAAAAGCVGLSAGARDGRGVFTRPPSASAMVASPARAASTCPCSCSSAAASSSRCWLRAVFSRSSAATLRRSSRSADEFEAYLKCGLLEHGFLRVKCDSCQAEKLVAYSCKRRGFCPSCGARRMVETAALLIDEVLPRQPIRQWVLSLPIALRYLLATRPEVVTQVLGIVYRAISGHLIRKAGLTRASAVTGAVTLIQRFGSALNL